MKTPVDDRLRREARHFRLRFACEDCAHFDSTERVCSNGFPTRPHLAVRLDARGAIEFCKLFELS